MNIRALFARLRATGTTQKQADTAADRDTGDRHAEPTGQVDRRAAWRPTARSAFGRHVQATNFRQAAIEAIHARGREAGIDAGETVAAMRQLDVELRARGWHPDQFPYDDEDPIDDFDTRFDVDYEPHMAAYDAEMARRRDEDGDFA